MKPLDGLTILDLSRVLACPFASMILAELGARVIKVEQPGSGDETRGFEPQLAKDSAYYFACNRSKESITVNLRSDEGKKLIRGLAQKADVVVENFPVGTLGRYGLDYSHPVIAESTADLRLLHRLRPDRAVRREEGLRHRVPGDGRHHEPDRRAGRRAGEAGPAGRRPHLRPVGRDRDPRRARRPRAHRQGLLRRLLDARRPGRRCSRSPPRAISRWTKFRRGSAPSIPGACPRPLSAARTASTRTSPRATSTGRRCARRWASRNGARLFPKTRRAWRSATRSWSSSLQEIAELERARIARACSMRSMSRSAR